MEEIIKNFDDYYDDNRYLVFILPSYWASPLINGDFSGIEDDEQAEITNFLKDHNLGICLNCSDVQFFKHGNDANKLGADCLYFLFDNPSI